MRGILNIIIGAVLIIAGLSGKMVLIGTSSGVALAVVGGIVLIIGLVRLKNSRS